MNKRKTTEEFIAEAKLVHGDKYDYSKTNYTGSKNKIIIVCLKHGEFEQVANSHLRGKGCKECGIIKQARSLDQFINMSVYIHNNKYDYSYTNYKNSIEKIKILCPKHGEFYQKPANHLQGQGCPSCDISKKYTKEEFIQKSAILHKNKYDYSKVNYVNSKIKITIICPVHGEFSTTPHSHLGIKTGCPSCADYGFQPNKPAYLYYLKVTTNDGQILYKLGITNRTVNERFNLTDLAKIEIVKQKLYENGQDALDWETKLKRQFKEYQYKGPNILSSGNTELFTEDIIAMC